MTPEQKFRELTQKAVERYRSNECNADGSILHPERACREVVQEMFDDPDNFDLLEKLVRGAIAYLDEEMARADEVASKMLTPALVQALHIEMGSEVQSILARRYEAATAGQPTFME